MSGGVERPPSALVLHGIDDVDDYIWANEGEEALPLDTFTHVFHLMQRGNQAFRERRYEEAIHCYIKANSIKPSDPIILSNRSTAYIRYSKYLIERPPSTSEDSPLNGLDPTTHAELALKDAEKLINLRSNAVKPYLLKASALILLERYEVARGVLLSGLHMDPSSISLQSFLQDLGNIQSSLMGSRYHEGPELSDEFNCSLCLKLFYEPITTPCGHSFCRSCLFRSMDRSNKCPLCRKVLFISPRTCSISVTLNSIIQKSFPEEYAARKSDHESMTNFGVDLLPLFVMDVVIPCQKFPLHIFEPRYRLMVRRIMEGSRRMGMVIVDPSTNSLADFACEVEITECEPLPDGRFYLEIESRRRFRIVRAWDQDGYRVAEIEWIQDNNPLEGTPEREELLELTRNASEYTRSWMRRAKQAAQYDQRKLEQIHNLETMMPTVQDPEGFSFWLVTLSNLRPQERLELLRMRDTKERIKRGLIYLNTEHGCRVQ
ncbi:hypothetical protein CsatB_017529 [Cannabis sativa]|uniref:uncharacterized protein LOC115711349 isoform X1 n=1 Tax=Cannabis sativa TaxID=3483 RepID=UPI0029C9EF9E|nr:uncharacterized protein LOC115711349 isoform X1 [Cannabis sativa]